VTGPTVGSLFAGIGGFDLGFQREGYEIAWQVEIDDYCQKVLAKHWPHVSRFGDVRDCGLHNLEPVDVITGGFPCTDISCAGKQAGLNGEQSSLWWEMHRIIGELRPRFAVVENVPNLFNRGIDRVCGSLAEIGYDAEWHVISAADVGAPHLRKRLWLVAHTSRALLEERIDNGGEEESHGQLARPSEAMADAIGPRLEGHPRHGAVGNECGRVASGPDGSVAPEGVCEPTAGYHSGWETEPDVGRVANGVSKRVDRLRGLGNAIVPQIAQHIAHTLKPQLQPQLEAVYA
jgi:DNA (cytosine-5)-methyltransferase 1